VGACAEMLRIRNVPVPGLLVGQIYQYVDDLDLDGAVDIASTTTLRGGPYAPVGVVRSILLPRHRPRDQFRADYQKLYDDGILMPLKYLGE
jgi:hypothetical protein